MTMNLRRVLSALAVAACLPYLTLKLSWLTGSTVGLNGPALAGQPVMVVANAITFGLDAVAVALAVAFVSAWGRRLPAWLVVAPMWAGAGLLGAIVLALPLQGVQFLVAPPAPAAAAGPLQPWVLVMVYGGFLLQGVFLLAGYWGYARDRWPAALTGRLGDGPARPLRAPEWVAVALAAAAVAARLGGEVASGSVLAVLTVLLLFAPVVAAAALVASRLDRPAGLPRALVTAAGYVASGAAAAWGVYGALLASIPNPLTGATGVDPGDVLAHVLLAASGFATAVAWVLGKERSRSGLADEPLSIALS